MSEIFIKDPLPVINPGEPHMPIVLLVDTSESVSGASIAELNQGLVEFAYALQENYLVLERVEVCIISFASSVQMEMGFRPAIEYQAPVLSTGSLTSLNQAIVAGLDALEERKQLYKQQGISYYRPWLFVLTDGAPTDSEHESIAKARLQQAIENKKVVYMPMGIGNADTEKLKEYYPDVYMDDKTGKPKAKVVLKANASNLKEAFVWLGQFDTVNRQFDTVNLPPIPDVISVDI